MSGRRSAFIRILRTPSGAVGGALLFALALLAVVAPIIWGAQAAATNPDVISSGPTAEHPFGTDPLGRDILFRTLVATQTSMVLAVLATIISIVIGLLLGVAPSLLGRRTGRFFAGVINIAVAFPGLLLVLFFAVVFGVTTTGAVLALGLAGAPTFARLVQTLAASLAGRDYISAASVAGISRMRILIRHIVPNMGEQLVINAMLSVGAALLAFAGLSFLGIGVRPPEYDWGVLLNQGLQAIYVNPAGALVPAAAVVVAGFAFNLFGEGAAQVVGHQQTILSFNTRPTALYRDGEGPSAPSALLVAENLTVSHPAHSGWITPVRGVSFTIDEGEAVGIVGESGSGKSQTALAVAALVERPGDVTADRLEFRGRSLLGPLDRSHRRELGTTLAVVFQDPMTSLNPSLRVGTQLTEGARYHQGLRKRDARARAVAKLEAVRIPAPEVRLAQYPYELSGGMRQRVMIATGLMGSPKLIIADEPTTALDATVQRQVLEVLQEARRREGAAILLISHDIGVVAENCDRVMVMYAGRVVEDLPAESLFEDARHPYTRALLAAVPDMESDRERPLAVIPGRPPEPSDFPAGCAYAARCPFADEICRTQDPALQTWSADHRGACWNPQVSDLELVDASLDDVSLDDVNEVRS